jgi:prophage antirepressor-like protein
MKIANGTKNSNLTSTPDCESVKIFSFDHDTIVEVVLINGEPYFVATDVCNALDLQNPTNILKKTLDKDEYLPYTVYRSGQQRLVNVVNESGLYNLIFQSRKPNARKFRKWITSEVLPEIRKKGMYLSKETEKALKGEILRLTGEMLQWKQASEQYKKLYYSLTHTHAGLSDVFSRTFDNYLSLQKSVIKSKSKIAKNKENLELVNIRLKVLLAKL